MQELSLKDIYDASSLKCCKVTCKVIVTVLSNIFLFKIIYLFLTILDLCFCIGLSLVVTSEDYSPLWCTGFLLWWLLLLQSMGSRHTGFHSYILWLSSCSSQTKLLCSMCDLPGPGIDLVSPAVAGGSLNSGLPGKSKNFLISLKEKISLPFPSLFFN